jgi:hypothetical protein
MLKKTITYENWDGETVTEDFYFNLTKSELLELEMAHKESFRERIQKIIDSKDGGVILGEFKKIVLQTYGEKSEDGKRFVKTADIQNSFSQTEAYSTLFFELATDAGAAAAFVNGIVPRGLAEEVAKEVSKIEKNGTVVEASLPAERVDVPSLAAVPPSTAVLDGLTETPSAVVTTEDVPPWEFENREPTDQELRSMTKEQMLAAFRKKNTS